MINIEHLCKSYAGPFWGAQKVLSLNDISLKIDSEKTLILSGTKNSGKSSLLKIMAAMMQVDSGSVKIMGLDLKTAANDIRRQAVYLTNAQAFFEYLNTKEHLTYFAALKGKKEKGVNHRIDELLKKWDLNPKQAVSKLSIEQKMILGLAQALLVQPKLLLMDEPALGLDFFTAKPIFDMISEAKKEGIGIVYACSNLSSAEIFGDEIAFLHQGKLVYQSGLETFLQNYGRSPADGFIKIITEANKSRI